jgi:hypothetical protein
MNDLHQALRRAERARELLDEPLLREALDAIEAQCFEDWRATTPRDIDSRERLWLMMQLGRRFRQHLESHIESGRLAKGRLAEIERERRFGVLR